LMEQSCHGLPFLRVRALAPYSGTNFSAGAQSPQMFPNYG
jgi:hypothetical protein